MLVRYSLKQWGLGSLVDEAELVISELVTNAVKTTGVMESEPRWSELLDLALIKVRLMATKTGLFIEVWDRDPTPPVIRQPTLDSENGRGLFIVAATCKRWNVLHPRSGGKVVWGELEIPPHEFTPGGLPKRRATPGPCRPPEVAQDPELLRRTDLLRAAIERQSAWRLLGLN